MYILRIQILTNGTLVAIGQGLRSAQRSALLLMLYAVAGCDSDSSARQLDDYDLAQSYGECLDKKPTAPGKVRACENLRRECERRKAELGSFVCRSI